MKNPSLFDISLLRMFAYNDTAFINGRWVPSRPEGPAYGLKHRLKLAWMVFIGEADVITWPGQ